MREADDEARELRDAFQTRCEQDRWSDAMRSCLGDTRSLVEPKNCRQHLTSDQNQALEVELMAIEQREKQRTLPMACTQYQQLVADLQPCAAIPEPTRAHLAARAPEAKTQWSSVADKTTLAPGCSAALSALRSLAADCGR